MTKLNAKLRTSRLGLVLALVVLTSTFYPVPTAQAQTLTPTIVAFGNWEIQTTSTAKVVTLSNPQTVSLSISSISVSGDFAETSKCPIAPKTLAAGASCKISVTFTPAALGASTGTLRVNDSSSTSPQTLPLSGNGVYPAVLSASSLAFGSQFVNTTSAVKVLTFQNNQTVPLIISGISTSSDFAQSSNCPLSPSALAARLSCKISITFTPTDPGDRTGTLTVSDSASNSPQIAQLQGTGTAPVSLSPASLTFASRVISTVSPGKSVTLKNSETVPLMISGISTSGDFAQTSTCPLSPNTLGAGASCAISVTFTPTTLGTRTGTLTITDSASTSPQTAALSGTGTLSGLLSILVAPANTTLAPGSQEQFVAIGTWPGGMTLNISNFVSWSSSAPSVASVNSTGVAQAVAQGVATITASYGSVTGATTVTVTPPVLTSIAVIPGNASVPVGAYEQFTAVLSYSDGSTKDTTSSVNWSSSSATVATVTGLGLASALVAGSTTIIATEGSVTGSTTLTVSQPQCVSPPPRLIGWWTGDGNTVDIAGNNSGTLQNGATYGNGEVGQAFSFNGNGASVLVNSPVYSPTAGTLMFWFLPTGAGSLTGSYDGINRTPGLAVDASGNLTWEFGNLSAQSLGQVGLNQWSLVALTYSTSNSEVTINVFLDGNLAASAIASPLSSWYPQVAFGAYLGAQEPSFAGSMDEISIFNQALSALQIQQIYNAFSAGMCKPTLGSLAVTPLNPSIAVGLSQQFDAAGSYSDGTTHDLTTSATWSSSNPVVATVNGSGQATAAAVGSATIAAALGAQTGSTNLSVLPSLLSIQVNPPNPSIAAGTKQPFTATGTFSDGSKQDLTTSVNWSSSLSSVATIATGGLANAIVAGQATITASAGSVSGSTLLTVTAATLTAITVAPATPTIAAGTTQPFIATGLFSDGSLQNLTASVSWVSSTPAAATINSNGLATGFAAGLTTITASSGSVSNSAILTVIPAVLTSITVDPANPSVLVGSTQQFKAIGTYSDNSTQDLTGTATWISSNTNVANLSSTGLASGLMAGTTTISATSQSVSGSTALAVSVPLSPTITAQPTGQLISSGQAATLAVVVTGTSPFSYQWYLGLSGDTSSPVSGATFSSYTTPGLTVNTSNWVEVSNSVGSTNSNTAKLVVAGPRHVQALLFPVLTANDPNFTDFVTNILPNVWGVSVEMQWNEIETSQGVYDFSTFDANLQPYIQAGKAVNLIVWPATEGGNNTPPVGSTPGYIFTQAWATSVGAATPQDMVVCGDYTGDSSNPFYAQALTRGGGAWNSSVSSDTSGLPVSYEAPFMVGFQNFIQAVIAHYNNNATTPIGYIRFGFSEDGEDSPLCTQYWSGPDGTGSYTKAEYLSYVQTMTAFVAQQYPQMTILADLHGVGTPPDLGYADSEAADAVANQQSIDTNGLQQSDIPNFNAGQPCDSDWCALFNQYGATSYKGKPITLSLQTLQWSDPTGQARTGSLVDLLPFIQQHGANNLELWLADVALAFSPNYCTYPDSQCSNPNYDLQQYVSAYQQAIQAFESQ